MSYERQKKFLSNRKAQGDKRIHAMIDGSIHDRCQPLLEEFGSWRNVMKYLVNQYMADLGEHDQVEPLKIANFLEIGSRSAFILTEFKSQGYSFEETIEHALELVGSHGMADYVRD